MGGRGFKRHANRGLQAEAAVDEKGSRDNDKRNMKHLSLFSGIGGFDLSSEWMGWTNVAHCEIDPFCRRILKHYWPNAITYEDIRTTDFTVHRGEIDILTGGFPCQPYSTAGKRLGKEDERHLWPEMLRAIREIQPRWVVGENVRGLISWNGGLVFDEAQADLEAEGYEVLPFLLPAAGVNAPHRRDRIWFVANYKGERRNEAGFNFGRPTQWSTRNGHEWNASDTTGIRRKRDIPSGEGIQREEQARGEIGAGSGENGSAADTDDQCRQEHRSPTGWEMFEIEIGGMGSTSDTPGITKRESSDEVNAVTNCRETWNEPGSSGGNKSSSYSDGVGFKRSQQNTGSSSGPSIIMPKIESRIGNAWEDFPTESPICGANDGLPSELDGITFSKWRTESLKGYGNAVVPQVVHQIFNAIEAFENGHKQNI